MLPLLGWLFYHPLTSRASCNFLTLQRSFLGTNLPDGVTFYISKIGGKRVQANQQKIVHLTKDVLGMSLPEGVTFYIFKFRGCMQISRKLCKICAIPHR